MFFRAKEEEEAKVPGAEQEGRGLDPGVIGDRKKKTELLGYPAVSS